MERLQEIQAQKDEVTPDQHVLDFNTMRNIHVNSLHFKYSKYDQYEVLSNLNFTIPKHKTTAIVGASGSGKTTLMKLLLKFNEPSEGSIQLDSHNLSTICPNSWRKQCGAVLQSGYIFNNTVAENIALGTDNSSFDDIVRAATTANIHEEIERLPQGYNTKIGSEGVTLSGGQIQRVLIARAIFKNPKYLFFDEATSALDANNESIIVKNLQSFFKGRTLVVIAHRLSTVKNADQIIVMEHGKIVEIGNHESLVANQGHYFNLVKNQLDLGH